MNSTFVADIKRPFPDKNSICSCDAAFGWRNPYNRVMVRDRLFLRDFTALMERTAVAHMGKHLYGGRGAELWETLAEKEPSYTVSRANRAIVQASLREIASRVPKSLVMIDLGPGGEKSVNASAEIAAALNVRCYRIKEASKQLREAAKEIARRRLVHSIVVKAKGGDVFAGEVGINYPTIAYFGGGTIGNLEHRRSKTFPAKLLTKKLKALTSYAPQGWLLLSFDTTHNRKQVHKMYSSAANSGFICNIMHRAAKD
jgi:uncharacterized SAM-dependent methyltransferase